MNLKKRINQDVLDVMGIGFAWRKQNSHHNVHGKNVVTTHRGIINDKNP
jgi:predicted alpha-1,6-mannanase (GH76 family)